MSTDSPTPPPRLQTAHIGSLHEDLAAARYTSARIETLLGPVASAALRRARIPEESRSAIRDLLEDRPPTEDDR